MHAACRSGRVHPHDTASERPWTTFLSWLPALDAAPRTLDPQDLSDSAFATPWPPPRRQPMPWPRRRSNRRRPVPPASGTSSRSSGLIQRRRRGSTFPRRSRTRRSRTRWRCWPRGTSSKASRQIARTTRSCSRRCTRRQRCERRTLTSTWNRPGRASARRCAAASTTPTSRWMQTAAAAGGRRKKPATVVSLASGSTACP